MKYRGPIGVLSALVLGVGVAGAVALTASPATATDQPRPSGRCATWEVETPTYLDGVENEQGGATVAGEGSWIRFKTPADDATTLANELEAYARWTVNPEDFKLKDLKELKYTTKIIEDGTRGSVAPAVRLILADGTTLVYEPYWNGIVANGDEKTWTITAPGAKLWDNGAEPAADETFADWIKPERKGNVLVKEINVGVGTYNEGADVSFKDLKFKYLLDCKPLDIVIAQPTCDVDQMRVKFTNPNTKVNAWLWVSTDPTAVRMLKPGASFEVSATEDVKYAYVLQKSKFGGKLNGKNLRRQMAHKPGEPIVDTIKYVKPVCETAEPTTPAPTTAAPTTAAPTTVPPTTNAPTTEVPVPAGNETDGGGSLAKTGAPTLLLTGGGVLLVVVGALLFLLSRRQREENLDQTAQLPAVQ
jgi:hypothetical protein